MELISVTQAGTLSIRSYTLSQNTHAHDYNQIVVPLRGSMAISVGASPYSVSVGHCLITRSGQEHSYAAPEQSRFLVADMPTLPDSAMAVPDHCVSIGEDLRAFCTYAEVQLTTSTDPGISGALYDLFWRLVSKQNFKARVDDRIARAINRIEDDLAVTHSIEALAAIAFLSTSQFKLLFRKQMGMTYTDYLTMRRMEQARTLLMHTDYPVSVVAACVGYADASAFSRRFRARFGQSPRVVARNR